jgi:hypothetical protein
MTISKILRITTIDSVGTRKKEDGFHVDSSTKAVSVACLVPDFDKALLSRVEEAIRNRQVINRSLFPRETPGFSSVHPRVAIVVTINPRQGKPNISLRRVVIRDKFTMEEANELSEKHKVLCAINAYIRERLGKSLTSSGLIYYLLCQFNSACAMIMDEKNIPRLRCKRDMIHINSGQSVVNKPLRDIISFFNCLQLSTYLRTGQVKFSKKEMEELIYTQW